MKVLPLMAGCQQTPKDEVKVGNESNLCASFPLRSAPAALFPFGNAPADASLQAAAEVCNIGHVCAWPQANAIIIAVAMNSSSETQVSDFLAETDEFQTFANNTPNLTLFLLCSNIVLSLIMDYCAPVRINVLSCTNPDNISGTVGYISLSNFKEKKGISWLIKNLMKS